MVNNENKLLGFNYTLPSWFFLKEINICLLKFLILIISILLSNNL